MSVNGAFALGPSCGLESAIESTVAREGEVSMWTAGGEKCLARQHLFCQPSAPKQSMQNREANEHGGIRAATTGTLFDTTTAVEPPPASDVCPKCGSHRTRIVGQSGNPPVVHRRCEDCGHVFSRPLSDD